MRHLHPALALGGTLAISLLLLAPLPARAKKSHLNLDAREAYVDSLVQAGINVESITQGVNLLRETVDTFGTSTPETAHALRCLGEALMELGDFELGASVWNLTLVVGRECLAPCDPLVIEATYWHAWFQRRVSPKPGDIDGVARETISELDPRVPEQRLIIGTIKGYRAMRNWRPDPERSVDMFEEAVELLQGTPDPLRYIAMRAWLGWTLLQLGRHDEARYHLERARDDIALLDAKDPSNVALIEGTLADLDLLSGDWTTAEQAYRRGVQDNVQKRKTGSTRFSEASLEGYQIVALAEIKRGEAREAWQSLQLYRGVLDKRLRSFAQLPARYHGLLDLRERVTQTRDLRRQWHQPETVRDINWPRVFDELEANAELFRREAAYYAPRVAKTVSLEELQSALPDNYAYIGWLNCRFADGFLISKGAMLDSCWMYVIRAHGPVHWIPLWEKTDVDTLNVLRKPSADYGRLMVSASRWTQRLDNDPLLTPLARQVAKVEFNPALPFLDGVDHLVVEFFEDRTGWKPIEALILPDGTYVGDRFAVAYTPSADAFVAIRRMPKPRTEKVLIVGDPVFSADQAVANPPSADWQDAGRAVEPDQTVRRAATNGDTNALASLPALRYAKLETQHLQKIFPQCTMLCEQEATEANVRRLLAGPKGSNFSIIHFATHTLAESSLRQRNALAMSCLDVDGSPGNDGMIDGVEIQLEWNLHADLVTLSGCRTLDGVAWQRGEPAGLAGLMLGAGAHSVLATSWSVDDLAAARLNARFYENLTGRYEGSADGRDGKPMSKAVALAEAKRWLRTYKDENGKQPFAHPIYWSGFILLGDPE